VPERPLPTTLHAEGGIALQARWDAPPDPGGPVVVLCHPHPLYGGTMDVPLLRTVAARLARSGCPVLRFNFRGVGASGGSWSGGEAEADDVGAAAAAAATAFPHLPLALAGWSFGAVMALRWQARTGGTGPFAGIAPPVGSGLAPPLPAPGGLPPARRLFLIGDRDQFTAVEQLSAYAAAAGASLLVLPGSDHFFYGREARVADALTAHFAPAGA
jgi:alpha/beta superfamily hydrolase